MANEMGQWDSNRSSSVEQSLMRCSSRSNHLYTIHKHNSDSMLETGCASQSDNSVLPEAGDEVNNEGLIRV